MVETLLVRALHSAFPSEPKLAFRFLMNNLTSEQRQMNNIQHEYDNFTNTHTYANARVRFFTLLRAHVFGSEEAKCVYYLCIVIKNIYFIFL